MNIARPPLVVIAGPTASGKSAAAIAVAEALDGVIVNADASQVYRDLRHLTARPSPADEARAPHRLFGYLDGADACSAARWAADARAAIDDVAAAGKLPILVGGTGLYLRTLLDGIAPVPPIDPAIRAAVRALPVADAHALLAVEDAPAAARLHAGDTTRVARALEVVRSTGRSLSAWQSAREGGIGAGHALAAAIILPDRADLVRATDDRLAAMFDDATREVAALLERGPSPDLPVMRSIGVASISAWLSGACTRAEALARAQIDTRRYAKRQYTWFRNQPPSDWSRVPAASTASQQIITKLRRGRLT